MSISSNLFPPNYQLFESLKIKEHIIYFLRSKSVIISMFLKKLIE